MQRAVIGTLAILIGAVSGVAAQERPRAFVELFTSQGCASCPAADALLADLDGQEGVLAVTMPVKLWDFLGWADTLATDTATKRQMAYSVARGDRDVYTPQVVVNGEDDVLGSDLGAIEAVIAKQGADSLPLPIHLSVRQGVLAIEAGEAADIDAESATLWLMVVDEEVRVPVRGGENRGRKLTYHNVVREMRPIGIWKGARFTFDLPLTDIEKVHAAGCYVIAQVETFKGPGRIIGAAKVPRLFPARTVEN